jgi:hypothetical protein
MDELRADLRLTFRILRQNPGGAGSSISPWETSLAHQQRPGGGRDRALPDPANLRQEVASVEIAKQIVAQLQSAELKRQRVSRLSVSKRILRALAIRYPATAWKAVLRWAL